MKLQNALLGLIALLLAVNLAAKWLVPVRWEWNDYIYDFRLPVEATWQYRYRLEYDKGGWELVAVVPINAESVRLFYKRPAR